MLQFRNGIFIIVFLLTWISISGQRLYISGQEVLINGMNIPWRYYGQDFGGSHRYHYDTTFYNHMFESLQEHGINTVRMWLHCDGRQSPLVTSQSEVTGLPRNFLDELDDFFDRAARYNLMVIPVLWSFEMVDNRKVDLIRDPLKTEAYINNALVPILEHSRKHCNILAWEIINEPEWAMDIPFAGTTREKVTAEEMQRFVGAQAQVIHQYTDHHVTVGAAGLRFLSDLNFLTKNYWSDLVLQQQNPGCSLAYLDFYTVHYYKWKHERLSPFKHDMKKMGIVKPTIISEFKFEGKNSPEYLLNRAVSNGYAGVIPWSMIADDGHGKWDDYREPLMQLAEEFSHMMPAGPYCLSEDLEDYYNSCLIYPNPASQLITISSNFDQSYPMKVEVLSMDGRRIIIKEGLTDVDLEISVDELLGGMYLVRLFVEGPDQRVREASLQKLMILH